jgi:hypothetical protein
MVSEWKQHSPSPRPSPHGEGAACFRVLSGSGSWASYSVCNGSVRLGPLGTAWDRLNFFLRVKVEGKSARKIVVLVCGHTTCGGLPDGQVWSQSFGLSSSSALPLVGMQRQKRGGLSSRPNAPRSFRPNSPRLRSKLTQVVDFPHLRTGKLFRTVGNVRDGNMPSFPRGGPLGAGVSTRAKGRFREDAEQCSALQFAGSEVLPHGQCAPKTGD